MFLYLEKGFCREIYYFSLEWSKNTDSLVTKKNKIALNWQQFGAIIIAVLQVKYRVMVISAAFFFLILIFSKYFKIFSQTITIIAELYSYNNSRIVSRITWRVSPCVSPSLTFL